MREVSLAALSLVVLVTCYQSESSSPAREILVLTVIGIIVLLCVLCPRSASLAEGFRKKAAEPEAPQEDAEEEDVRHYTADDDIHKGVAALKSSASVADARAALKEKQAQPAADQDDPRTVDPNNPHMNAGTADKDAVRGHNVVSSTTKKRAGGSRIDYAATLDEAYKNLNDMLGSDEMKSLTTDTMKLMEQQKQLFDTMSSMAPMIDSAKSMMQGMDMKQLMSVVGKPI